MSNLQTFCDVTGVCYDLTNKFLISNPWYNVLKNVAVTGVQKTWSSSNNYVLVLKEAETATVIYRNFARTIANIEKYIDILDVRICSLDEAKKFLRDFKKVLEIYSPKNATLWKKYASGERLRGELQHYVQYMHSMISNINLELQYVNMHLQSISNEKDSRKRERMMALLVNGCEKVFDDDETNFLNNVNDDDDYFEDALM